MSVLVIVPAAGMGTRFGTPVPKQFQLLAGKPIVQYVVERFLLSGFVEKVVVAVSDALLATVKQAPGDRVQFVAGGETRQQSVMAAFNAAGTDFDVVAVHDAVRPFFRMRTFEALLDAAREFGAALPAIPVTDTIHATQDGKLTSTLDRTNLVSAQTPQVFRYDVLRDALDRAVREKFDATDEAGIAARCGYDVRVIAGDPFNIKITRPEDLALAEAHFEEWSAE